MLRDYNYEILMQMVGYTFDDQPKEDFSKIEDLMNTKVANSNQISTDNSSYQSSFNM